MLFFPFAVHIRAPSLLRALSHSMDTVIQSSCRNAFVSAAKCIQSTGLRNPECKEAQDKLYACTLKEKLAAQQVVLPRRGNGSCVQSATRLC